MGGYPYDPHSGHLMDSLPENSGFISVSLCVFLCMLVGEILVTFFISRLSLVILVIANSGLQIKTLECPVIFT